jgi:carbon storage regulator CsrA
MLVLTRRPGDSITLPELGIIIRVLDVRGFNQIRIGIEAPSGINIVRTELLEHPQVEVGAAPIIKPEHLNDIKDVLDGEPLPRFMTPMMKVDYYSRQTNDSKPATGSVRGGDVPND